MTAKVKVQRNGAVTIPKEWRNPDFEAGKVVEATRIADGILLHPAKASGIRPPTKPGGWRAVVESSGGVSRKTIEDLNRVIEEEFEQVDPEEWK